MGRKTRIIVSGSRPEMMVLISDKSKLSGPTKLESGGRGMMRYGNWRIRVSKVWWGS